MGDLKNMMDADLVNLQRDIQKELTRRSVEKMIPIFGVKSSPINQHEFADPKQAFSCAAGLLDKVLSDAQNDLANGLFEGWNGNLLCIYVQHVSESDFAILQPHLRDKKS
ncbi:hypothetical protein B7L51_001090 [Pectobacterium brasiliense]|uniref:hypothetical protein n=1 Tax=Pectobacterium brasiliense TaxID=180957 RepID=UPI000B976FDA|nr:hypothetical protein [Pectobacterium carotovorum]OYN53223.1 hypothetical protein B7L51_01110 [Pectobacterium carotovorum]